MSKFVKVIDGLISNAGNFEYKVNEINIANNWNPTADNPKDFGGFNFCDEECVIRWLHRGDTIYDVEIPDDAEVVKVQSSTIVYRTNKIIILNPRKIDDDYAMELYKKSNIPEKSYYKALSVVAVKNYKKTALKIFEDKANKNNINEVIEEWKDFIYHNGKNDREGLNETVIMIEDMLLALKNIANE